MELNFDYFKFITLTDVYSSVEEEVNGELCEIEKLVKKDSKGFLIIFDLDCVSNLSSVFKFNGSVYKDRIKIYLDTAQEYVIKMNEVDFLKLKENYKKVNKKQIKF